MGNVDTKLNFRKAVVQLTSKSEVNIASYLLLCIKVNSIFAYNILFHCQPIDAADESFWEQFWSENVSSVQDIFTLVPASEIRALREESPSNLATLCYKAVEKLVKAVDNSCRTQREQQTGNSK